MLADKDNRDYFSIGLQVHMQCFQCFSMQPRYTFTILFTTFVFDWKILCEQHQMRLESKLRDNLLQTPLHDICGLEVNPRLTFKSASADLLNYSHDIKTLDVFRLSLTHINV